MIGGVEEQEQSRSRSGEKTGVSAGTLAGAVGEGRESWRRKIGR